MEREGKGIRTLQPSILQSVCVLSTICNGDDTTVRVHTTYRTVLEKEGKREREMIIAPADIQRDITSNHAPTPSNMECAVQSCITLNGSIKLHKKALFAV